MTLRTMLFVTVITALGSAAADSGDAVATWLLYEPAGIQWRAAENLPQGAQVAVLEGDPTKEGFFTMRLKMPDGYRVPPHFHSMPERVTVLSGTLNLGTGTNFDPKTTKPLPAGTYSSMPPAMSHFGWTTGETVLQLTTMGPWTITYVNPADDPRLNRPRP